MNIALIPVRGGSKSIPLKNIKEINGQPLVYWVTKAACECPQIDKVYISTDSDIIRENIQKFDLLNSEKLEIVGRSEKTATDTASTESVMMEFAQKYEFDTIALIQATSPLLKATDLTKGFNKFDEEDTDSVLSVVKQKRFNWKCDESGFFHATNYDIFNRPRRQEFNGYFVENGAFYITSKANLLKTGNRISGNIKCVEMDEKSFLEIDEENDWKIIELIMKSESDQEPLSADRLSKIKMILTDCDGCLTDGGMYYSEKGDEIKKFNTRDGMAFSMLRKAGIKVGIITSEDVELNARRAEKVKADIYVPGCKDKLKAVQNIIEEYKIDKEELCYIGDDINDRELLRYAGIGACPSDADDRVKEISDFIIPRQGGAGVFRYMAELVLRGVQ